MKKITPTLSLFLIAEKAKIAETSVANSLLNCFLVPKLPEPERSMRSITVISLSSSNIFIYGSLFLAVTFQSINLTSSPELYFRTSENAIPFPLNAVLYSPAKI